jgi:hypothetical protein
VNEVETRRYGEEFHPRGASRPVIIGLLSTSILFVSVMNIRRIFAYSYSRITVLRHRIRANSRMQSFAIIRPNPLNQGLQCEIRGLEIGTSVVLTKKALCIGLVVFVIIRKYHSYPYSHTLKSAYNNPTV